MENSLFFALCPGLGKLVSGLKQGSEGEVVKENVKNTYPGNLHKGRLQSFPLHISHGLRSIHGAVDIPPTYIDLPGDFVDLRAGKHVLVVSVVTLRTVHGSVNEGVSDGRSILDDTRDAKNTNTLYDLW